MGSSPLAATDSGRASGPVRVASRYTLRRKLGSGSVGTVYLAQDAVRREEVALKLIRTERLSAAAVVSMQREFRAIASLGHRQIASAYDFGYTEDGLPYYTREYIPGVPLPSGPPENEEPHPFLRPILDLLDALEYLHAGGVLHLDIHAGNLILSSDAKRGSVLIDFGFVRSPDDLHYALTASGWPDVPPELLKRGEASPRTDVFFVGSLLHYRLTGRAGGEVRLPREIPGWGARLTLELERIATKALQPAPAQRFQSALEFREALSQVLGERERQPACLTPRGALLGRERELRRIEERLRTVAAGKPALLVFCGHAGLGKTRLLGEARLRAQLRGFEVLEIHGMQDSGRGPLLVQALRRSGAGSRRSSRSKDVGRWLEPLDAKHGGTPRERAQRMAEAYFLEAGHSLVLSIDDLDAIDRESRVLVEALVAVCAERRRRNLVGRGLAIFITAETHSISGVEREDVCQLRALRKDDATTLFRNMLAPLTAPESLLEGVRNRAGGVPLHLLQLAGAVREEWDRRGAIPDRVELLADAIPTSTAEARSSHRFPAVERRIVDALRVIDRPARLAELAVAIDAPVRQVGAALRRLRRAEVVVGFKQGRNTGYRLHSSYSGGDLSHEESRSGARRLHERVAAYLESSSNLHPGDHEHLARHLLAAGRVSEGCRVALRAVALLRQQGSFDRAYRLLREVFDREAALEKRLRLAETMSAIAEETGDHQAGIDAIAPLCRELDRLSPRDATRVRRCLGIHYHRAGAAEKALEVLEGALRLEDTQRDLEDAIFIDSELAEIYTFRGEYVEAEKACYRGLERLESVAATDPFRVRMEVTLRASLGHLEMRRMRLDRARRELTVALKACRREGTTAHLASILNNLGITANQQNDFPAAKRYFKEAERLLLSAGERRGTIKVAANLAIIDAKLGDRDQSELHLAAAEQLLPYYRDRRLEFFVAYSRGVASLLLGESRAAIEALERALPLGTDLGDDHMVQYGEVYLAEAHIASGDYKRACRLLRDTARRPEAEAGALLTRMVHSRTFFLEALLGRKRLAKRAREGVDRTPRTDVALLEAWNDVYYGLALVFSGRAVGDRFDEALRTFRRLGMPFGEQFTRLALVVARLARRESDRARELLDTLDRKVSERHRFLAVARPLARAETAILLREHDAADQALSEASGAIVGSPFLELDWRIELMRSRLAVERGHLEDARRHLHRSLHTRDLLLEHVPSKARVRYLAHPRFEVLTAAEERLRRSPQLFYSTAKLHRVASYEGMIGRSTSMRRVFQLVEKVADQEMVVLLQGETGTGKELLARAIHRRSSRRERSFMAVHCASLPGEIFESEIFGTVAGAYTGADEDRAGILETVSGGTLLFDEVGQLAPEAQGKLLQVLDSRSFRRLGSMETRRVDVRILASTSEDLAARVREGRLRADLYYRLSGMAIELPPLRERASDVPELARYLVEKHAQRLGRPVPPMTREAVRRLRDAAWPGNVRELEGVLLRVMLSLSGTESMREEHVAEHLGARGADSGGSDALFDEALVERHELQELKIALERQYLTQVFLNSKGDGKLMMQKLGVKRTRLYTWFRRLGLDVRELRKRL